jgi:hypothetical protein
VRNGRGKPAGIVTIAIARELVGACWEIATAAEPDHIRLARRGGAAVRAPRHHERPRFRL